MGIGRLFSKRNTDAYRAVDNPSLVRMRLPEVPRDGYQQPVRTPEFQQQVRLQPINPGYDTDRPPPPPPPQRAVDPKQMVKDAIKEIHAVQREARIDDMRWRAQAKEYLAQERNDEAETLINSLIESMLWQRHLDKMVTAVQLAGRNARINGATKRVFSALEKIVHAQDNDDNKVDMEQVGVDLITQNEDMRETLQRMQDATRLATDPTGLQTNAERTRIRHDIIRELREEMTGSMPTPAVTQVVAPQPQAQNSNINPTLLQALGG